MASSRASWLPPLVVFALVSFLYVVYLLFHLLPQLRRLNFLQYSSKPLLSSVPNDPHMHPAPASEVMGLTVAFHACFIMFLASFFQTMVTPPGAVPQGDAKWERGHFGIDEREDKEVERIIRDTTTDLNKVRRREETRSTASQRESCPSVRSHGLFLFFFFFSIPNC